MRNKQKDSYFCRRDCNLLSDRNQPPDLPGLWPRQVEGSEGQMAHPGGDANPACLVRRQRRRPAGHERFPPQDQAQEVRHRPPADTPGPGGPGLFHLQQILIPAENHRKRPGGEPGRIFLLFGEIVFPYAAQGANPVCGKVFKGGSGGDSVVGVAGLRVVLVPANIAYILFHTDVELVRVIVQR